MYSSRTLHWLPYFPGRERARTVILHHGSTGCSGQGLCRKEHPQKVVLWYVIVSLVASSFLPLSSLDASFAPRAVVNSKGRRRRPGTKTLAQVLRCNDEEFVDFISKCLVWDPERRIKPQAAMRHPFVTAGRRPKPPPSTTKTTSGLTNSRSKQLNETPKKSLISAPTPLTARTSRTTVPTAGPTTPSNSSHASSTLGSSSRSYRASQPQGLSSYSSRTLNGFTVRCRPRHLGMRSFFFYRRLQLNSRNFFVIFIMLLTELVRALLDQVLLTFNEKSSWPSIHTLGPPYIFPCFFTLLSTSLARCHNSSQSPIHNLHFPLDLERRSV